MHSIYLFSGFSFLVMAVPLDSLSQTLVEADQSQVQVQVIEAPTTRLSLVDRGMTYSNFAQADSGSKHTRTQVTLEVGDQFTNTSSNIVLSLDADCFRMVSKLVFAEPLVGPIEPPPQDSLNLEPIKNCPTSRAKKVVSLSPGQSYEARTQLKFEVIDKGPAHLPRSLNPGVYFLQITMSTAVGFGVNDDKGPRRISSWTVGYADSDLLRFVVEGKPTRRLT